MFSIPYFILRLSLLSLHDEASGEETKIMNTDSLIHKRKMLILLLVWRSEIQMISLTLDWKSKYSIFFNTEISLHANDLKNPAVHSVHYNLPSINSGKRLLQIWQHYENVLLNKITVTFFTKYTYLFCFCSR